MDTTKREARPRRPSRYRVSDSSCAVEGRFMAVRVEKSKACRSVCRVVSILGGMMRFSE